MNHSKMIMMAFSLLILALCIILNNIIIDKKIGFRNQITIVFLVAVFIYFFIIGGAYNYEKRIDLFQIFIGLSFPFLFGGHLLTTLNIQPGGRAPFRSVISRVSLINTSYFCCEALLCVFIGYLIVNKKSYSMKTLREKKNTINNIQQKILFNMGAFFTIISFIPFINESIQAISMTFKRGYGYRIVEGAKEATSLSAVISGFFLPSIFAMFISKSKKNIIPTILIVIYFIIYTLQGSRIATFCYLSLFLYIYFINTESKYNVVKLLPILVVFILVFPLISGTRSLTSSSSLSDALNDAFYNIWNNNPLAVILNEAANTFNATAIVLDHCPNDYSHIHGISYICAFIYVLPNAFTGNFLDRFSFADDTFAHYLTKYGGIGSSFPAEAYYNFGWVGGLIFLVFIGIFWGWLCKKIEYNIFEGKIFGMYWYFQIYTAVVFMIRSELLYRLRPLFWYAFTIVFISYIIYTQIKRMKNEKIK